MISLSNLITNTWSLYNNNLKIYLKLSLLIFLITVPVGVVSLLLDTLKYTRIASMAVSIVLGFFVFILTILITIVLVRVADDQISAQSAGRSPSALSTKNEFKNALQIWFAVLFLSIVVGLIQTAGFIFLLVPGILFSVWFAFAIYYIILGPDAALKGGLPGALGPDAALKGGLPGALGPDAALKGGLPGALPLGRQIKEALLKSKTLVKGRFWGVLLRIFAPTILWSLFGWAVSVIFMNLIDIIVKYLGVAQLVARVTSSAAPFGIVKLLGSTYINALFVPLFIISMVILFRNLQVAEKKS